MLYNFSQSEKFMKFHVGEYAKHAIHFNSNITSIFFPFKELIKTFLLINLYDLS